MKDKIDWRMVSVIILTVLTTSSALYINQQHNDEGIDRISGAIETDNGDTKINWERYRTINVELNESLNITESGTYHLTGEIKNGLVTVNAGVGEVRLILDNVTINNDSGPAIACYFAEDLVIELVGKNTLSDGKTYDTSYDEDVTGAIYSKSDLTFNGDGELILTANYQDGIVGKDDLKFNGGKYTISAEDDGIRGKDSVYIVDGDFVIKAVADGIKSTNETTAGKGYVLIENGNLNIKASGKGIKAVSSLLVYDGKLSLTTSDDAIHSDNYVGIKSGEININSQDDAIHADKELIIDGGSITVAKAYEGLEAQVITIHNGNISLTTTDDGINAGGGADSSASNHPGAGMFDTNEDCVLSINGGDIYINASGDGVDSNGWLYFNGGQVVVDGPTNNGNGALDSGMGIVMNGGEVIAIGASGMAETLGSSSSVYNISVYFGSTQAAGTSIVIKDSSNNTVMKHTSAKTFNHISAGTEAFKLGETYTIYINNEKYQSFTISSITTTIGSSNIEQNYMPRGPESFGEPTTQPQNLP